jgi:hypothetical protein
MNHDPFDKASSGELIIPDAFSDDVLSDVNWLKEHLSFSDEYFAQLVGVPQELFCQWKRGEATLTSSQVQTLEKFSTAIRRVLSYYGFRRDLMMRVLEVHFEDRIHRTKFTPPWVGSSLKDYLLHHGGEGSDEVDSWVQSLKFG